MRSDDRRRRGRDLGPQLRALLGDGASDGGSLHLTLDVDDDARVVLEIDKRALAAPPCAALADHDTVEHLLAQLWLALLDGPHEHVTERGLGQAVEARTDALHGHDIEVLATAVVRAVHHRRDLHTASDPHLRLLARVTGPHGEKEVFSQILRGRLS